MMTWTEIVRRRLRGAAMQGMVQVALALIGRSRGRCR